MDGEASQSDTSIQVETIRRVPLDAKGVCGVCEKDSEGESLRCFGCDELYHVIGCTGKKRVTQTLLEQWGTIARNYSNVQFVCDACKHDKQAKKDIVLSNRLCVMEEQMTTMTDMILQIKKRQQWTNWKQRWLNTGSFRVEGASAESCSKVNSGP